MNTDQGRVNEKEVHDQAYLVHACALRSVLLNTKSKELRCCIYCDSNIAFGGVKFTVVSLFWRDDDENEEEKYVIFVYYSGGDTANNFQFVWCVYFITT
jgi:hypothetical protein